MVLGRVAHTVTYGLTPMCTGKAAYDTESQALSALANRVRIERERLWAYKCQHRECPYYHLTRKKPPVEWLINRSSVGNSRAQ